MDLAQLAKISLLDTDFTIEDLTGPALLSGAEDNEHGFVFIINDIPFVAIEDENDGYRSMLGELKVYTGYVGNTFLPVEVEGGVIDELLTFTSVKTGKVVLEVGTDGSDSYYPIFIHNWMPENLV